MARQVKVMVSLTEEEAGKLDVFMAGQSIPVEHLGRAGMLRIAGMAYIKMWLRWQANPDSMEVVGSSDT